jgi:hypothetical protein
MRAIVAAVVAMALGFGVYAWQTGRLGGGAGGGSPTAIVDTVAVKTDLLSMANAMKQQFALEAKYVSLAELRARGVPVPERRGPYVYTANVTDMTFTIKATYETKEGEQARPTLTIGPDMQIKEVKAP